MRRADCSMLDRSNLHPRECAAIFHISPDELHTRTRRN